MANPWGFDGMTAGIGGFLAVLGWLLAPTVSSLLSKFFSKLTFDAPRKLLELEVDTIPKLKEILRVAEEQMMVISAKGRGSESDLNTLYKLTVDLKSALYEAEDILDLIDYHQKERSSNIEVNCTQSLHRLRRFIGATLRRSDCVLPISDTPSISMVQSTNPTAAAHVSLHRSSEVVGIKTNQKDDIAIESFLATIDSKSLKKRIEHIENIVEDSKKLHLLTQDSSSSQEEIEDLHIRMEQKVFGREKEREYICRMLREGPDSHGPGSSSSRRYSVIGICGITGSGKSTLAQYVCDHEKKAQDKHFDLIVFSYVSMTFRLDNIFRDMLEQIMQDRPSNTRGLKSLLEELKEKLKDRRFLLVLDDLWVNNENQEERHILLDALDTGKSGSAILVTAQRKDAPAALGAQKQIQMLDLEQEAYLSMFMHYALDGMGFDCERYIKIGRKIAERLHRSPLAAVTVAAQLRRRQNISFWVRVAKLDVLDMTMGALWWSYQQLGVDIMRCFAYCSTFPRGCEVKRDELVRIWIAQGFVNTKSNTTEELEDVSQHYFNELLSLSFLQTKTIDGTEIVVINDMLYELAERVGGSDFFKIVSSGLTMDIPPMVRHLSVRTNNGAKITEKLLDLVNLRTLIIVDEYYDEDLNHNERLQHPLINEKVFESIFKRLSKLRVLIVMTKNYHKQVFSVPASIDQMKHLRYLTFNLFSSRQIVELIFPNTFSKLYHMQTINVVPFCKVSCPKDMANLIYLRHITVSLSFPSGSGVESLQQGRMKHSTRNGESTVSNTGDRSVQMPMLHQVVLKWFELITVVKDLLNAILIILAFGYRYLSRKVVTVSILGLLFLAYTFGALDLVFNTSLGMRTSSDDTMFNKIEPSHGRMLHAINHGTEDKGSVGKDGIISVDLRVTGGNADYSWKDPKALAHWILNQTGNQLGKDYEDIKKKQNGTEERRPSAPKTIKTYVVLWIAIASAIFVVFCFCCIAVLLWYKCGNRVQQNEPLVELELWRVAGPKPFQYDELAAATKNFTNENKLGQGGFGPVYRGFLRDPDRHVAVKVLSTESSWQGQTEFKSEVKVMTQLRHRNIVQLIGWCSSNRQLLLVYELMAEGSLDKHLYNPEKILPWQQRYKIILDLGSALFYLHQCCEKCIVHGDIKPENVMLDASYNAKLGDFGTARLIEHGAEPQTTEIVAGTRGYIDPEFMNNRLRCPEADVYSFGVALLEIACGKRPASRQPNGATALLSWVRNLYDRGMILDAADEKLSGEFDQQQMEHVLVTGLWCAHQDPSQRPSIAQAMDVLRSADAKLPVLPPTRDPQHFQVMMEQAYGDLAGESPPVDAVNATTYLTSKDSDYLLAEE